MRQFEAAVDAVVAAIGSRVESALALPLDGKRTPQLVAIDGGSGAGKSTLAHAVAAQLSALGCSVGIISVDDFFAAQIDDAGWASRSAAERACDVLDWRRLRTSALEPLLAGARAMWYPFDFEAGPRADGSYALCQTAKYCERKDVILVEGAYAARPELRDLLALTVLVDVSLAVRHARLAWREPAPFLAAWHAQWDEAEAHYLNQVSPAHSFDLVVSNDGMGLNLGEQGRGAANRTEVAEEDVSDNDKAEGTAN